MITYKDRAFCAQETEKHTCDRELSEKDKAEAERLNLPILWGFFCGTQPYNQRDHTHCKNQDVPACGIPKEKHTMCCLCGVY